MANSFKDNMDRLNALRQEALEGGGPERIAKIHEKRPAYGPREDSPAAG